LVLFEYATKKNGFFLYALYTYFDECICFEHYRVTVVESSFQAHGTLVCGENGVGVAEEFNCEGDVDICIGSLSKATGCVGGFIACR
jgi:hypothetical protein